MSAPLVQRLRLIANKGPTDIAEICAAAARTIEQDASLVGALCGLIPVPDLLDATANGLTMVNYFRARLAEAVDARTIVRLLVDALESENPLAYPDTIARAREFLGRSE